MKEDIKKNQKTKYDDQEENKVWVGGDGLMYVQPGNSVLKEGGIEDLFNKLNKVLEKVLGETSVLVHLLNYKHVQPAKYRKRAVELLKGFFKNPKLKKAALYGGNSVTRTVVYFVVTIAVGEKIKLFKTEEEAKKWLKE